MFQLPEMILFDYGQTLIDETDYDTIRGNHAVLQRAVSNPRQINASQLQKLADELSKDMAELFGPEKRAFPGGEFSSASFNRYLYEYLDIKLDIPWNEVERIFWDHAAPGYPTAGMKQLLGFLHEEGIRTAVVSNMMKNSETLTLRINRFFPENHFEFIMTSCDYLFKKPHPRIFKMACAKAKLSAEKIWYCGDNLICDVKGSYQAGMSPVWYGACAKANQTLAEDIPYLTVMDWKELIQKIDRLIAKEER